MRIRDWSSDVCSSDLPDPLAGGGVASAEASQPASPAAASTSRAVGSRLSVELLKEVRGMVRVIGVSPKNAAAAGAVAAGPCFCGRRPGLTPESKRPKLYVRYRSVTVRIRY